MIPREQNTIVDTLATSTSIFRIHIYPNSKYEIEVKYRPSIQNNVKHWQVFEDDQQIKRFIEVTNEFSQTYIDEENQNGNGDEKR